MGSFFNITDPALIFYFLASFFLIFMDQGVTKLPLTVQTVYGRL